MTLLVAAYIWLVDHYDITNDNEATFEKQLEDLSEQMSDEEVAYIEDYYKEPDEAL